MGGSVSLEAPARSKEKGKKKKKKEQTNEGDKDLTLGGDEATQSAPFEVAQQEPQPLEEWPPGGPGGPGPPGPDTVLRPEKDYLQDLELPSPTAGLQEESTLPVSPLSDRSFGIFGFLPPQGNSSRPYAPAYHSSLGQPAVSRSRQGLRLRILRAYNLKTSSTGLPGDLADPYVSARVGRETFHTSCMENDPNPVWTEDNEHIFKLDASSLELQIMSMNAYKDEVLGKVTIAIHEDQQPGEWQRHKLPLVGTTSQIEFEMQLVSDISSIQMAAPSKVDELEYQGPRMFQPKGHALPWHGVRVLELTRRTWTAALCGQMMAALGAEVIRVASRSEALQKRGPGAEGGQVPQVPPKEVPRQLHQGKRLVLLDPEKPEELQRMKSDLLMSCSLFLTDLPADELDDKQLGASTLRQQFPWLIFVHTSAVGMLADVTNKGVNDAGAFFCLSGMAEQLGHFLGPPGFAAACAASALLGVSSLALLRRRCGCPGDRVEMSIFRSGRWCTALGALTGWLRPASHPELRPAEAEGLGNAAAPVPFDVEGVGHVPLKRGKAEGQNLKWSVLDPGSLLPAVEPENPISSELPLARVSVIEISDEYQVSAIALGALLADLGARVTKLERPQRPDPWKHTCPQLYKDLTARKNVQVVNYSGVGGRDAAGAPLPGQSALYRSLANTTLLVTNLPVAALESWGLDPKHLREMFPHLIIVWINSWGSDASARHMELSLGRKGGQEAQAFWEASGLSQLCNGSSLPPGLGELAVAQHALGGVGLALLRQQRTGQGQMVQVSRYGAGVFCHRIAALDPPQPLASPLLQTLDGRFMRLLGRGHQPHDAWVLLHALKRRDSLAEQMGGSFERMRSKLQTFTWEDLQKHQDELLACAREWSFQDLAKAFQEKGIDWFVEELRPMDAEALHRRRAEQLEQLRQQQQNAAEKALEMGHRSADLQQHLADSQAKAHDELQDRLLDQHEQQKKMELLREQYNTGVPPVVGVTVDGAKGLTSPTRGNKISTYCVIEVVNKPYTRLQTPELQGPMPLWDYTGVLSKVGFGDVLKFAVYRKEPVVEVDHTAAAPSVEHTTVLYLQVAAAYNLMNRDTGVMGDVSDPYVTAQVGEMLQQTPTINNDLNPVWKERNQFAFNVLDHQMDRYLYLEVMNSNMMRDDSLGKIKLDTRSIEAGHWNHYRLKLDEGQGGELEFDVYMKPAEPCKPHGHKDELIGRAEVGMSQFYPHGFEGTVPLFLEEKATQGVLDVFIEVHPQGVKLDPKGPAAKHRRTFSEMSVGSRSMAATRSQVSASDAAEKPPANLGESEKSVLQIRVNQTTNLTNRDSGFFGDVSDPYVVVRAAGTEQKTPTIDNDLNPIWKDQNLFSFSVGAHDNKVELEVMDANRFKDVTLGSCELDLRSIQQGMWTRFSEKLVGGLNGELAFDLYFKATEYRLLCAEQGSVLHVRVNNARHLPNTDSGVMGDLSDPYVIVKVGDLQRRTPTIDNDLNPDWKDGNLFTFSVSDEDAMLELEVMNANLVKDDSLGKASVRIGTLDPSHWLRLVQELEHGPGEGATVELDVFFKPNERYHLNHDLEQAKKEEKESLAEAARLSKEVQMAERAQKWLDNVEENTKMPLSMEERDWASACGGRNFVAPAWITVTQTQVEALVRARDKHPHAVALFRDGKASPLAKHQKLKVKLMAAFGLDLAPSRASETYCTCEIPLKKHSKIHTDPVPASANPEWRFSRSMRGYDPGDALVMEIYSRDRAENTPRADQLLGRAFLPGDKFYPNGFDGLLNLTLGPRPTGATLRVTALVMESS